MLVQSGINMQLEQALKYVQPYEFPMKNLPHLPEVECLGFQLADLDINFRKGYLELSCSYTDVDTPSNPEICDKFLDAL